MKKIFIPAILLGAAILFMGDACSGTSSTTVNLTNQRAQVCTPGFMTQSSEVWNICTRYNRLADVNHVSYMYLLGNTGDIIAEYQVIGKCTSTDSQVTNPTQAVFANNGTNGNAGVTIDNQQLDGSYGQNEQAVYCFIDNANKTMVEFSTQFIWTDAPLPLNSPPQIVIVPNGK